MELGPAPVFAGLPIYSSGPVVSDRALYVDVDSGFVLLDPVTLELVELVELPGGGGDATVTPDGSAWIARYTARSATLLTPGAG